MFGEKKQSINKASGETELKPGDAPVPTPAGVKQPMAPEDTSIYFMPDSFQAQKYETHYAHRKQGKLIVILGLVLLAVLAAAAYIVFFDPSLLNGGSNVVPLPTPNPNPNDIVVTSSTPVPAPATSTVATSSAIVVALGPKDTYIKYKNKIASSTNETEVLVIIKSMGTPDRVALAKKTVDNFSKMTATAQQKYWDLSGEPFHPLQGNEIIKENIDGSSATVTITYPDRTGGGQVGLLLMDGVWKVNAETWTGKKIVTQRSNGADSDSDGLTDAEETAVGSDPQKADTDGDSHLDGTEVANGYNPIGAGKLISDQNITTYINDSFGYSCLYPDAWTKTVGANNASVKFSTDDGQAITITIAANTKHLSAAVAAASAWNVAQVPASQQFNSGSTSYAISSDGLTAYLTDKAQKYLITFTYNLGDSNIVNYKTIFRSIVVTSVFGK